MAEPKDITVTVKERPPKDGNGISFYIVVRVDRNTFGKASPKDARNLVRRQFQYALPEILKAVDQEYAKVRPEYEKAEPAP